jgi:hypothetical protein
MKSKISNKAEDLVVVAWGNPFDGFNLDGPFFSTADAIQHAENSKDDENAWFLGELTLPLLEPEDLLLFVREVTARFIRNTATSQEEVNSLIMALAPRYNEVLTDLATDFAPRDEDGGLARNGYSSLVIDRNKDSHQCEVCCTETQTKGADGRYLCALHAPDEIEAFDKTCTNSADHV